MSFDLFMGDSFTLFYLIQPLANAGNEIEPLCNDFQVRVIRQPLDGFNGKLFIAHAYLSLPQAWQKCNGAKPA